MIKPLQFSFPGFIDFDAIRRALRRGLLPDLPDFRDFDYSLIRSRGARPASCDWTPADPPIRNQLTLGSCVGHGGVRSVECLDIADGSYTELSELDLYYQVRKALGTVDEDSGGRIKDAVRILAKRGVCSEKTWPYDVDRYKEDPGAAAAADAAGHKIADYHRIGVLRTLDDVLDAIAQRLPVVFGFSVYSSALTDEVARTGVIPMPTRSDSFEGGHCVVARGYDDKTGRIKGPNSWGEEWGEAGNYYLPYEYIERHALASDIWVIRKLAQ